MHPEKYSQMHNAANIKIFMLNYVEIASLNVAYSSPLNATKVFLSSPHSVTHPHNNLCNNLLLHRCAISHWFKSLCAISCNFILGACCKTYLTKMFAQCSAVDELRKNTKELVDHAL